MRCRDQPTGSRLGGEGEQFCPADHQVYFVMNEQPQLPEPSTAGLQADGGRVPPHPEGSTPVTGLPAALILPARVRTWSWTWLVPLAAVVIAVALLLQAQAERGRTIRIRFEDGGGIQANDPVMYRGVHAGRIRSVTLAPDLNGVLVTAELRRDAQSLAVDGSKFWIVRPVVSLTRVSGLETLIGPRYIEVDPGPTSATLRSDFIGQERSPTGLDGTPRRRNESATGGGKLLVVLQAAKRGSVTVGSPVFFRDVKVGVITAFELSEDARTVDIKAMIEADYAGLVRTNTRFWNASGIGVDFGFSSGFSLKAGSIESVFAGGIAFATPTKAGARVQPGSVFRLENEGEKNWWEWSPDLSDPEPAPLPGPGTPP